MTQEQLADTLSVTAQAVSRWETNTAMPDISLLPSLANLFDVTTDYLLGVDITKKAEKIDGISNKANDYSSRGYLKEARSILEAGLHEYPGSYKLMRELMYVADWQYNEINYGTEEKNKLLSAQYQKEAISLGEAILFGCTDDDLRHGAIQILCFLYKDTGNKEKAHKLAMTMPVLAVSRESLLPVVTDGNECYAAKQSEVFNLIQFLEVNIGSMNVRLDDGKRPYTGEMQAALRDKQIAFLHLMYENGDFGFFHSHLCNIHQRQARYYAGSGKPKKALEHLNAAAEHAIRFIQGGGKEAYTSLLFVGFDDGGFSTGNSDNDAAELLKLTADAVYDSIRDTDEFKSVIIKLKEFADKWEVK